MTKLDLLSHLWQSTAVAVAVLVLIVLCRGIPARTRRILCWMALAKFAIPLTLTAPFELSLGRLERWLVPQPAQTGPTFFAPLPLAAGEDARTGSMLAVPPMRSAPASRSHPLSLTSWLLLGWAAGALAVTGSWIYRALRVRRELLASAVPLSRELDRRLDAAAAQAGLDYVPRGLSVDIDVAPAVVGLFSPVLIVPRDLENQLTDEELHSVLLHEMVHIQRGDSVCSAFQTLVVSLLWFNPVVWLLSQRLYFEAEKSCDERVLELTRDPDAYAGGILKCVRRALGLPQPIYPSVSNPPIADRIRAILAHGSRRENPLTRRLAVAAAILLGSMGGLAGTFAASAPPPAPAPTPVQSAPASAQPAPAQPAPAQAPSLPRDTITIDFPDTDIRTIITSVADLFELNVIIPEALGGRATIKLRNVTWPQIYSAALQPQGFTFTEGADKIIRIVPLPAEAPAPAPSPASPAPAQPAPGAPASQPRGGASLQPPIPGWDGATVLRGPITTAMVGVAAAAPAIPASIATSLPASGGTPSAIGPIFDVAKVDVAPVVMVQPPPEYPFAMRSQRPTGSLPDSVTVGFVVDRYGDVVDAWVTTSTKKEFEKNALAGVKRWKFRPGRHGGTPVNVLMTVEVLFTLVNPPVRSGAVESPEPNVIAGSGGTMRVLAEAAPGETGGAAISATAKANAALQEAAATASQPLALPARGKLESLGEIFDISKLDRRPVALLQGGPEYPFEMRRNAISGTVTVEFIVDSTGKVASAWAANSTHREFEKNAVNAVSKWKFEPGRKSGRAVSTHMVVEMEFKLPGQAGRPRAEAPAPKSQNRVGPIVTGSTRGVVGDTTPQASVPSPAHTAPPPASATAVATGISAFVRNAPDGSTHVLAKDGVNLVTFAPGGAVSIPDDVYRPSWLDQSPRAQVQFKPEFPSALRSSGVGGFVTVAFIVDRDGSVPVAWATQSSDPEFEQNAALAVSKWRFTPGRLNGKPVATAMKIDVLFNSNDSGARRPAAATFRPSAVSP